MSHVDDATDPELDAEIILRTSNTLRARLVADLLASHDIPCSTPGLEHLSMVPLGGAIQIAVSVPRKFGGEARRLIADMESEVDPEGDAEPAEVSASYRESAKKPAVRLSPRLKRGAAMAAFIFPGGAHFYVHQYAAAFAVIAGYVVTIAHTASGVPLAFYFGLVVLASDIAGAMFHCDVDREGKATKSWRRFAPMGALAMTLAWGPLALGPLLPALAGHNARVVCDYAQRCSPGSVTAEQCLHEETNYRLDGFGIGDECAVCLEAHRDCADTACQEACSTREGEP